MSPEDPVQQRWWLRRLVNRFEMDRATFYVVATRGWRLLAGPVTMLLIAWRFSREVQGYYYTFWNVLSLQALVDLGISGVILQCASHEWAQLWLEEGRVAGDRDAREHLAALVRYFHRWFLVASAVFVAVVALLGAWFFSDGSESSRTVDWLYPWLTLTALTGYSLTMIPRIAVLEGCGQMAAVNRMRLLQMVAGNLAVWTSIYLGLDLWVTCVAAAIQVAGELLLLRSFRHFYASLPEVDGGAQPHDWERLVRPMQWRVSLRSGVKFFAANLITPVVMRYQGAAAAGRVGMTWHLLTSLQQAAYAWIGTRRPLFGQYVAKRQFERLDQVFRRLTAISVTLIAVGCASVWLGVVLLSVAPWRTARLLGERLVDPTTTAVLGAAVTLTLASTCISLYLHAHRRSPQDLILAGMDVLSALLVWQFGARYGPLGGAAVLAIAALLRLPLMIALWHVCRQRWHNEPPPKPAP